MTTNPFLKGVCNLFIIPSVNITIGLFDIIAARKWFNLYQIFRENNEMFPNSNDPFILSH